MGSFREFAIEPPSKAICVPEPHTSGGVALSLIATHRSQSLFVEVTKQSCCARTLGYESMSLQDISRRDVVDARRTACDTN